MHPRMHDLLLNRALRLTVVGTISALGLVCLILGYRSLFELINGNLPLAGREAIWGALAAGASLMLIRYRTELIDS